MISRLEVYIILGLLIALPAAFFGGDLHGHLAEARAVHSKQTEADAKALSDALRQAQELLAGDQAAAQRAADKLGAINKGIDDAAARLGKLPSVVVDARGCERLSSDWGLRWDSVESLSGRPSDGPPGLAPGAVRAGDVQPPR